MNRDEITMAMRFIARGQPNHPAVEALVTALESLLSSNGLPAADSATLSPRASDSRSDPSAEDDGSRPAAGAAGSGKRRR